MQHRYHRVPLHQQTRDAEVLCAVARLTARSTDLPRAAEVTREVRFDATEILVRLARKGLLNAYGPVRDNWYSLSPAGTQAVARHCRRVA